MTTPTYPLSAYTGRWQGPTLTPTAYEVTVDGETFWTPVKPTWTLGWIAHYRNQLKQYPSDTIILCERLCGGLYTVEWVSRVVLETARCEIQCPRCGARCKEVDL